MGHVRDVWISSKMETNINDSVQRMSYVIALYMHT